MTKKALFFICALVLTALDVHGQQTGPLRLLQTIPLPNVKGRIDHFDVDPAGHRLFMCALGNNTLEVFDLRAGNKRIHTVRGLREPQGVTYAPESNHIFVANGGDGTVRIFDGSTYGLLKTIHLPSDADDTRYDPATKQVFVGYGDEGNAGLAILDGMTGNLLGTIKLPAHPESFQLEGSGPRIFVNVPSEGNIIEVVDRNQRKIVATWKLGGAQDNFPMALDEREGRLFVGCRAPNEVVILDTASGKVIGRIPSVSHADDVWYDAANKRAYESGGEGFITVIGQKDATHYERIGQIKTRAGARTSCFVPQLKRLYLGVWDNRGQAEELQVYEVLP
ncbi:MAG TPA: YncE family protein [Candidatus Acidoferrales bacterium]|nr:YncE family protein [Candidatus Acidoferrales bacterium]